MRFPLKSILVSALFLSVSLGAPAQTLTTADGLTLGLSSTGSIDRLDLGGTAYAAAGLPSGFAVREAGRAGTNLVPNPSFESGTTGWLLNWVNTTYGHWALASPGAAGATAITCALSGTTEVKGPPLKSSAFPLFPAEPYRLTFQSQSTGLSYSQYPTAAYLVELDTNGQVLLQHPIVIAPGTTAWVTHTLDFVTSPSAAQGYITANIYSGYGAVSLDDVRLLDGFSGVAPQALTPSMLTSDATGITETAHGPGLGLSAHFTPGAAAIAVDVDLTETTGADRAIELSFRLPINASGWTWDDDLTTSHTIAPGTVSQNVDANAAYYTAGHTHSRAPFAVIRSTAGSTAGSTAAGIALAIRPGIPLSDRLSASSAGLSLTWDLGLSAVTKTPSHAHVAFWIYRCDPAWGFRDAAREYYALSPDAFTTRATAQGAWLLSNNNFVPWGIANSGDFGWAYDESPLGIDWDAGQGIKALQYQGLIGWVRDFGTSPTQPTYPALADALVTDAASAIGTDLGGLPTATVAQATLDSAERNSEGQYQVLADPFFWYGPLNGHYYQMYPTDMDPDIPGPSFAGVIAAATSGDAALQPGVFFDDLDALNTSLENDNKALWSYADAPLSFSYKTLSPCLLNGESLSELALATRDRLHGVGRFLMGSAAPESYSWFAPYLDVIGGEVSGAESTDRANLRRVLGQGKVQTNLLFRPTAPSSAEMEGYLRQGLMFGFYPGCDGRYWSQTTLVERDRPLFVKYLPAIREVTAAGWQPVTDATADNASVRLERYGIAFLVAQNNGAAPLTSTLTLSGAGFDFASGDTVTAVERLSGAAVAVSAPGSPTRTLTVTLAPGEVQLYRFTVTHPLVTPPVVTTNPIPNPNFTGGDAHWSVVNPGVGTWAYEATSDPSIGHMVLSTPDPTPVKSSFLQSDRFALAGGVSTTFSAWMKGQGISGSYPFMVYLVECDATGAVLHAADGGALQHPIKGAFGTTSWTKGSLGFTTDPRCARGYVYANFYETAGTAWLTELGLTQN